MYRLSVAIAVKDPATSDRLAHDIRRHFRQVALAHSGTELRHTIAKVRAEAAIVDLELLNPEELGQLCEEFPGTAVVATHRSPDNEMWTECLEIGAVDCCHHSDIDGMLRAIAHNVQLSRSAHAA